MVFPNLSIKTLKHVLHKDNHDFLLHDEFLRHIEQVAYYLQLVIVQAVHAFCVQLHGETKSLVDGLVSIA